MRAILTVCFFFATHFALAGDPPSAGASPAPAPSPTSAVRTDRLFFEGKVTETPIFTQETHIDDDGNGGKTWDSKIKDAAGEVVMTELAHLKNDRVIDQAIEQRQIGKAYDLVVADGKATFRTFEWADGQRGKELEHKTVEANDHFLMGPMTDSAIQKNWDTLMSGKTIKADFGVFEAARTIEFKFFKSKDVGDDVEIHMKPASFVIAMMVPTIKLRFNKTTRVSLFISAVRPR